MTIEGRASGQIAIAAGKGMDGVDGDIMLVHEDAHAWDVTRKGAILEGWIGSVVAVVGLTTEDVLLEIPEALLLKGAVGLGGLETVIQQTTLIVDLHDEGLEDKREVEISRDDALACTAHRKQLLGIGP